MEDLTSRCAFGMAAYLITVRLAWTVIHIALQLAHFRTLLGVSSNALVSNSPAEAG